MNFYSSVVIRRNDQWKNEIRRLLVPQKFNGRSDRKRMKISDRNVQCRASDTMHI